MPRLRRRVWIGLASFALAGIVGLVAIADHRHKSAAGDRAELAEWYCTHLGTRCGGPSSAAIERRWNERELGYEVAVTILGLFGTANLLLGLRRRPRSEETSRQEHAGAG